MRHNPTFKALSAFVCPFMCSLCTVVILLVCARTACAQASLEPSIPGTAAPGISGFVNAMIEWDPDGAGPQPTKVYVGGTFQAAGNTLANNIAAWNGTDWEPLGAGVNGEVLALCVHDGALYAGGTFMTVGGNMPSQNLAKWTGTAWANSSPGMTALPGYSNEVRCLASFGGSLYVGGTFDTVGGYNAHGIIRFTASGIETLGTGLTRATNAPYVNCLQVWQGGLMIGGYFDHSGALAANNIARWTGTTWSSTGVGVNDSPEKFALLGSNLLILTDFGDLVQCNSFNTYTPMAPPGIASSARTYSICTILGGALHVGGYYQQSAGGPITYLYRWTGTTWVEAAPGLNALPRTLLNTSNYLYAGSFYLNRAGSAEITGIARWNGAAWSRMGPVGGLNGYAWDSAKNRETDTLWIVGSFTSNAGTPLNHVAQWNGTTWAPSGAGFDREPGHIVPYNGSMIAVGYGMTSSSGAPLGSVAQWNGTTWVGLASVSRSGVEGFVSCAVQWGNQLVVGGYFDTINGVEAHGIAAWDGTQWHSLSTGMDSIGPDSLAVYNGDLIAAGDFTVAGGVAARNIARWDGTVWHAMGTGIDDNPPSWANTVESMTVLNNELYVAGNFGVAGGVPCRNIAKWNGASWSALGTGLGATDDLVWSLTTLGGKVYAASTVYDAQFLPHGKVFVWDGASWVNAGGGDIGETVYTITEHRGEVFMGGPFGAVQGRINAFGTRMKAVGVTSPAPGLASAPWDFQVYNGIVYAGSPTANAQNFTQWNGSAFVPVPSQPAINGNVLALGTYTQPGHAQKLIVSGTFSAAGPNSVANITGWEYPFVGTPWSTVGSGLGVPGNSGPSALLEYNGNLYASGQFSTPSGHFARWNGTTWSALSPLDGAADSFVVYQGQLIAGGNFTTAGGQPMRYVARWNGSAWSPLGSGLADPAAFSLFPGVRSLAVYNGELYAGGQFTVPGTSSPNIAKWNGSVWSGVGGGQAVTPNSNGFDTSIAALAIHNGKLVVGGFFDSVGPAASPTIANSIATWDGSAWSAFGSGPTYGGLGGPSVRSLEANGCELFIGGNFDTFNGVATPFAARWSTPPVPPFVNQPQDSRTSCVGSTVAFQITHQPVACYAITYQWKRNGVPIANGITPWGSFVTNATTPHIVIASAQAADQGNYTCTITGGNGAFEASDPANLFFPCVGCDSIDFNHDDLFPDTQDILNFIEVFAGSPCPTGTCGDIDFNNDGLFPDTDDITAFISIFSGGPCAP